MAPSKLEPLPAPPETLGSVSGAEGGPHPDGPLCREAGLPARHTLPPGRAALRIGTFFAVLLLAFVAVEALITGGLRRMDTGGYGVTNRIVSGEVNAEIVISGSSRALNHYDPRIIQRVTGRSVFNIGRNGSQTDMQVAVLKTYLEHNTKPKLIIHNLDLFAFKTSHGIYDPGQYLPYLDEEQLYGAICKIDLDAWKWKWLPLYGYAVQDMRLSWLQSVRTWTGIRAREDHFNGFMPRHQTWTGDFESMRASHPDGFMTPVESQGIRDFENLASLGHANDIPMLFVYSPEYSGIQALERDREDIVHRLGTIAERYSIPIWDYSSSPICRDQRNFYNSQHLNATGATAFSHAFAEGLVTEIFPVAEGRANP